MEFRELPQKRKGRGAGPRQQQRLAGDAARVAVLDQLAPARGKAKASAG
jgi:hypothetical protein